jgi:hypothetical protein
MGQDTSWLSNHVCHGNSRQNSAFQKEKDPGADHRAKSSADLGFSTAPREADDTSHEWVMLAWEEPQAMHALAILRGRDEPGPGDAKIEVYAGKGDPRYSVDESEWVIVPGRWSGEGSFRAIRWYWFERGVVHADLE